MIDRQHDLPITRQAQLLGMSRGTVYYLPRPVSDADLALMRRIDNKIYPYLLRKLPITRANQVWALDTTYISRWPGALFTSLRWWT